MLGLRAWGDGLNGILFEFLDDDTKLAQSCRNWLYVQHWYVVAPDHFESFKKTYPTCPSSCVSCPASQTHVRSHVCLAQASQTVKNKGFFCEEEGKGDSLKWCPHKVISAHMLGHVHGGQPTVIFRVPAQSKRKVNAWICAPRTTDHDPANVIFNKICNICNVCNVCNFHADVLFSN